MNVRAGGFGSASLQISAGMVGAGGSAMLTLKDPALGIGAAAFTFVLDQKIYTRANKKSSRRLRLYDDGVSDMMYVASDGGLGLTGWLRVVKMTSSGTATLGTGRTDTLALPGTLKPRAQKLVFDANSDKHALNLDVRDWNSKKGKHTISLGGAQHGGYGGRVIHTATKAAIKLTDVGAMVSGSIVRGFGTLQPANI